MRFFIAEVAVGRARSPGPLFLVAENVFGFANRVSL
jgi:hypothetical protein